LTKNVLVTSASGAKGLVVTRSLGRHNINVFNTDSERYSAAFFSKYSKGHFLTPSPLDYPNDFIPVILDSVKNNNIDLLMPVNSVETLLICKHKDKFTPYTHVPFEDYSKMIKLHDKGELAKVAEELNIPIPKTYEITDLNDIEKFAESLTYPVVIKLKQSTSSVGVSYAFSQEEFISLYKETIFKFKLEPFNYPLVQEYITGTGYGVSLLMNHGELRAIFTHKRLREYPITGGPSTLRESVRHPEMESIAVKLLKHFNWHGIAMVEFKLDQRTNRPYLIEVNPRFWGSLNQAILSGVDFPYLLYEMEMEGDINPVTEYKVGLRTGLMFNDFRAQFHLLKNPKCRNKFIEYGINIKSKFHDDIVTLGDFLPTIFYVYTNLKNIK
jgi:predicted ATP-grasp superfamily ATP-dependent carboligase